MRNKVPTNIFIGLVLIILGVGFFLDSLGYVNFGHVFGLYWPVLVLLFALMKFIETRFTSALIWLILGIFLLINTATNMHVNFWDALWPVLLIWVGVSILLRGNSYRRSADAEETDEERLSSLSIFTADNKKSNAGKFKGANVTAIFGGSKLDLRDAKFDEEGASLDVFVAFGGAEILVPKNIPIKLDVFALFGGSDDKRASKGGDGKAKLTIRGTALFGGVEIKE